MSTIIAKIIICMLAAAALGFVIGWLFSTLLRNEKHQTQILAAAESIDLQKATANQLKSEFDAKERELMLLKEEFASIQKEVLSRDMDREENKESKKLQALKEENQILLEQIKEQKLCEDENNLLSTEVEHLTQINQELLEKNNALKEFETSYKQNIHKIAELESLQKNKPEEAQILLNKITVLENENHRLSQELTAKQNLQAEKELLTVELEALEAEKENFIEKLSHEAPQRGEKNEKNLQEMICDNKPIITTDDLTNAGLGDDKISEVLKNLFMRSDKKHS